MPLFSMKYFYVSQSPRLNFLGSPLSASLRTSFQGSPLFLPSITSSTQSPRHSPPAFASLSFSLFRLSHPLPVLQLSILPAPRLQPTLPLSTSFPSSHSPSLLSFSFSPLVSSRASPPASPLLPLPLSTFQTPTLPVSPLLLPEPHQASPLTIPSTIHLTLQLPLQMLPSHHLSNAIHLQHLLLVSQHCTVHGLHEHYTEA